MEIINNCKTGPKDVTAIFIRKFVECYIIGLTFDFNKKHLYYIDRHANQIGMVDYEGITKNFLFTTLSNPRGLKYFEDHLYYLGMEGYITRCKLFDTQECENFKLHSYSNELFSIMQKSLQPKLENVCSNHTCKYLCLPVQQQYRCLCNDGSVILNSEECSGSEGKETMLLKVHSVAVNDNPSKNKTGIIVIAILIPVLILAFVAVIIFVIKRRNSGSLNISMRFYNPTYGNQIDDEKPILQPGQHEYTNPVHFSEENSEISTSIIAKRLNDLVVD